MQRNINIWKSGEATNPAMVLACRQWQPHSKTPLRVVHPYWAIDYTETPGATYRVKRVAGRWQTRPPGLFHLYAPQTPYWENNSAVQQGLESLSIVFRGGSELGLDYLLKDGGYAVLLDPSGRLKFLMAQASEIGPYSGDAGFAGVQMMLWQIAGLLGNCQRTAPHHYTLATESREPGIVEIVDRYLQQHLADRVTVDELARELNLSSSSISHHYKKRKGQSIIASLIDMRVQTAKVLLLKGYPLKTIATQTGFCDAFHLSRSFSKATGMSPREFSKRTSGGQFE